MAERSAGVKPESEPDAATRRRVALGAMARWAVPLQLAAILATGGGAAFLALRGRWQGSDWIFVGLCAFYIVNAWWFRRLSRRSAPPGAER